MPRATIEASRAYWTGRKFTTQHLANLSSSHLGHVHSDDHNRKISSALRGRVRPPEETRKAAKSQLRTWAVEKVRRRVVKGIVRLVKISAATKSQWTPEHRAHMVSKLKGRKPTPQTILAVVESNRRRTGSHYSNNP